MLSHLKDAMVRGLEPRLHWSSVGADLPGARVIEASLSRASAASWTPPHVIGASHLVRMAPAIGTVDRNLIALTGARLVAQNGVIELSDGSLLAEPAWHPDTLMPWLRNRPARLRSRRQRGRWFSCVLAYSYNYYHWICDVLPRFHRVIDRLPGETRFVVPGGMAPWQWESLEAVGIARDRCAELPADETWLIDELYYAPPAAVCGDHDPEALRWLRETILPRVDAPVAERSRRLYITRRLARRPIVNEAEIEPLLRDYGFTIIEAERLSFAEQVRAFAAAECVMGPQGSGLANILWSRAGIRVVEVFAPAFATQRADWTLACALGHRYLAAVAEDADARRGILLRADVARSVLDWICGG